MVAHDLARHGVGHPVQPGAHEATPSTGGMAVHDLAWHGVGARIQPVTPSPSADTPRGGAAAARSGARHAIAMRQRGALARPPRRRRHSPALQGRRQPLPRR